MSISETQRFAMHTELRKVMGEEVADTMMEYMPPVGWADVARKSDIDRLNRQLEVVENRLDQRIDGVVHGLWALGAITVGGFVGLFALIATKL